MGHERDFDGQQIRLVGVVGVGAERQDLCASKEAERFFLTAECIWLVLDEDALGAGRAELVELSGQYVAFEGIVKVHEEGRRRASLAEVTRMEPWESAFDSERVTGPADCSERATWKWVVAPESLLNVVPLGDVEDRATASPVPDGTRSWKEFLGLAKEGGEVWEFGGTGLGLAGGEVAGLALLRGCELVAILEFEVGLKPGESIY